MLCCDVLWVCLCLWLRKCGDIDMTYGDVGVGLRVCVGEGGVTLALALALALAVCICGDTGMGTGVGGCGWCQYVRGELE